MGGKGGGGGIDTSGMEDATKQATALQKEIYDLTREDVQPWYQAGVGGLSKLSDLLGISGGSVQDRQGIYDELLPQYAQQEQTQTQGGGQWLGKNGGLYSNQLDAANSFARGDSEKVAQLADAIEYIPTTTTTIDTTDYDALNAAVDERLGSQGTPEGYGSLLERFDMDKFEQDPGYQFRQDEARKALERQMAAQGITLGGGGVGEINPQAARAMEELSQGLASQEYGSAYDRYNIDQTNTYNRLAGIAGMGQQSTGQMAGAGQNYATNVGNLQTGLASAQLNAAQAQASKPSMFSQLLGAGAQIGGAALGNPILFSDRRLKDNIKRIGTENGHNLYEFNYLKGGDPYLNLVLDTENTYIGVMADEVEKTNPEAITVDPESGYKMVDYNKIGVEMRLV
tara:strand:- start:1742 stop:2935 length:1194 start_codon:yes stop_codon:yes gene_type:complete